METDLVCGAQITEEKPRFFSDYNGRVYPFCSPECKRKFDDHPDYFIHEEAKRSLPEQPQSGAPANTGT